MTHFVKSFRKVTQNHVSRYPHIKHLGDVIIQFKDIAVPRSSWTKAMLWLTWLKLCHLLTEYIKHHISASNAVIVSAELCFNCNYLSKLYDTVAFLYILYIVFFWKIFTHAGKHVYTLRYTIWTCSLKLSNSRSLQQNSIKPFYSRSYYSCF